MKKDKIFKLLFIITEIFVIFYISVSVHRYQQHVKIQNEVRSCLPSGDVCKE